MDLEPALAPPLDRRPCRRSPRPRAPRPPTRPPGRPVPPAAGVNNAAPSAVPRSSICSNRFRSGRSALPGISAIGLNAGPQERPRVIRDKDQGLLSPPATLAAQDDDLLGGEVEILGDPGGGVALPVQGLDPHQASRLQAVELQPAVLVHGRQGRQRGLQCPEAAPRHGRRSPRGSSHVRSSDDAACRRPSTGRPQCGHGESSVP